ncbi:hypothetical protein HOY80DRAFT_1054553 [Tuber brumale]|nr:hypothetical protein HOY80DRAFT_1054553 [Tuber brumale]
MEVDEEKILLGRERFAGSMIGRSQVLCMWAVDKVWKRFFLNHTPVVERAFTTVGLSLLINRSLNSKISIKGLEMSLFVEGIKEWAQGAVVDSGVIVEDHEGVGDHDEELELDIAQDELDGEYIIGEID